MFFSQEGAYSQAQQAELRVNFSTDFERFPAWDLNIDYQILADNTAHFVSNDLFSYAPENDEQRLFNFSDRLNKGRINVVHRLDRFNLGYTGEKLVLRFGRQALSWGSGLLFSVMDIVNPFDGRVYDQEYKVGDDMLSMQYLLNNGHDFQFASVLRRKLFSKALDSTQHTFAGKYHGFLGTLEFDALIAQHYDDEMFALGLGSPIAGAIIYAEIALNANETKNYRSGLIGINYSWVWFSHNFTGAFEMYHNDKGLKDDFSYVDVVANATLTDALRRGETRLLAANYFAASTSVEVSPLIRASLNMFYSLEDQSALAQLSVFYDWRQNAQLFAALSIPLGPDGDEFSGLGSEFSNRYYSNEYQGLIKLAWYY